MNLRQIRAKLAEISGRMDLVASDGSDDGADFYIQEGSKFLDRRAEITESVASKFCNVEEDDYYVTFDMCRAIHEVWFFDANGRGQLKEATLENLKTQFPQLLLNSDKGVPGLYAPINVRIADGSDPSPVGFLEYIDITGEDVDGILFPPCDRTGTIQVIGRFYSATLAGEASTNYWSHNHPMLLIWAALYQLEVSYRNTEGSKDWLNSINVYLDDLYKDKVEQSSHNLRQMGGREND